MYSVRQSPSLLVASSSCLTVVMILILPNGTRSLPCLVSSKHHNSTNQWPPSKERGNLVSAGSPLLKA